MKRFLLLCMSCFLLVSFSACGKTEKINDESTAAGIEEKKVLEKQEEKNNARVSQNTEGNTNVSLDEDTDLYVGEYNSYDVDEPDLEIAKNEDGTYAIQIGMYRLVQLDQCVGEKTDEGIAFSTTEWDGKDFSGLITVEGNDAIVRFTSSDWAEFTDIDIVYRYYKISGVPNIKNEN